MLIYFKSIVSSPLCSKYHSPLRRSSSGSWIDYYTNQTVNLDELWHKDEPNGKELEDCSTYTKTGEFIDVTCDGYKACSVCLWRKEPIFTLRGLCRETTIERDYVLKPNITYDNYVVFFGFYRNIIVYNKDMNARLIVADLMEELLDSSGTVKPKSIVGTLMYKDQYQMPFGMPFGLHVWNVTDCNGNTLGKLTSVSLRCSLIL